MIEKLIERIINHINLVVIDEYFIDFRMDSYTLLLFSQPKDGYGLDYTHSNIYKGICTKEESILLLSKHLKDHYNFH